MRRPRPTRVDPVIPGWWEVPLAVRAGVLVVDGWGVHVRVRYGRLDVEDGVGPHRRSVTVARAEGLERLVLLGATGTISIDALEWLRAIGAAFVHIARGELLTTSVPYAFRGPIRRAQALAPYVRSGDDTLALVIARDLVTQKVSGQHALLRDVLKAGEPAPSHTARLAEARTIDAVRSIEAQAALLYWSAWSNAELRWKPGALSRIPNTWTRYDKRMSVFTGSPRAATHPINALLNFTYALLETEMRVALAVQGLDPTIGVMHTDKTSRDSLASDAMEPLRPEVDRYVLDLVAGRRFDARDFVEMPTGVCRLAPSLTHDLALTLPRWRALATPIAAGLAARFRALSLDDASIAPMIARPAIAQAAVRAVAPRTGRPPVVADRGDRPYVARQSSPRAPQVVTTGCERCGEPVRRRRRRFCDACRPIVTRIAAERNIEAARKALRAVASKSIGQAYLDPRNSKEASATRGAANSTQHQRNRSWSGDRAALESRFRDIAPLLDRFTLGAIAQAAGISLGYASRIRAGHMPHARHIPGLLSLVESLDKDNTDPIRD